MQEAADRLNSHHVSSSDETQRPSGTGLFQGVLGAQVPSTVWLSYIRLLCFGHLEQREGDNVRLQGDGDLLEKRHRTGLRDFCPFIGGSSIT